MDILSVYNEGIPIEKDGIRKNLGDMLD